MQRLQRQGVVRCFEVTRNQKLTKAEIASVAPADGVSAPLPRWNVTVTAASARPTTDLLEFRRSCCTSR